MPQGDAHAAHQLSNLLERALVTTTSFILQRTLTGHRYNDVPAAQKRKCTFFLQVCTGRARDVATDAFTRLVTSESDVDDALDPPPLLFFSQFIRRSLLGPPDAFIHWCAQGTTARDRAPPVDPP